jgi:autotransporter-associated beta strand protein
MQILLMFRLRMTGLMLAAGFGLVPLGGAQIPAFPGAEGFGAYATGGRGGDVYTVVNLNSSGPGSLRYGVENAPAQGRTIVFAVSGYIPINYNSDTGNQTVRIVQNKVTIAGQTAPGAGIGLKDGRILITGDNSVMRHIRIRHGKYGGAGDCLNIESSANDTMLDHVTLMFSTDENVSFFNSNADNFTLQYCTSAWGMERHNAGGLWDLEDGTCHHTLWAHHRTRNPKARPNGLLEWINNVTYHWRSEGFIMGDSETPGDWYANVIGCYYLAIADYEFGLDNTPLSKARIASDGQPNFHLYLDDCLHDADGDGLLNGTDKGYGIVAGVPYPTGGTTPGTVSYDKSLAPFAGAAGAVAVTIDDPLTAYKKVLSSAGALRLDATYAGPLRDELDTLLVESVENQVSILVAKDTPRTNYPGDPPSNGEALLAGPPYNISNGGFGTLNSTTAPTDSDGDGMPDYWETTLGSNVSVQDHNSPVPAGAYIPDVPAGYTLLEEYLHFKAIPHAVLEKSTAGSTNSLVIDLRRYARGFNVAPVVFSFTNVVHGNVGLQPDGYTAVFIPTLEFAGRARFDFAVTDGDGSTWTQTLAVLVNGVPDPRELTWKGDGVLNVWDTGTLNFLEGNNAVSFFPGDSVLFDDSGSASPAINISGALSPAAVRVDSSQGYAFSGGTLSGPMNLLKQGTGTLTINNTLSHTGGTLVDGGTLTVNNTSGSGTGTGSVTVNAGGKLMGTGILSGAVVVNSGGTIAPGTSIGTLIVNNAVTLNGGSTIFIEINKTSGTSDRLDVSGTLTLGGLLAVSNLNGSLASGDSFKIFDAGNYAGSFSVTNLPALSGTLQWNLSQLNTSGTMVVVDPASAPPAPTGLTATAGDAQVTLSWTPSVGATSYIVKRGTLSGGPYTSMVTNATTSYVNTGLLNGTTYYYVVTAANALGESANSSQKSATPAAAVVSYQVNSGGAAASPFVADVNYSGGGTYTNANAINTSGVSGPAPAAVYQSERKGSFSYTFPGLVLGANYLVRLHFAEIFHSAAGLRAFDVFINGSQVLTNFDIYAAAGAKNKALIREFTVAANGSGQVVIQYVTVVDNAKSSGIQLFNASTAPQITTQPSSQAVTAGSPVSFSVQVTGYPNPVFQWMRDGTNLMGQTSGTLTLANAQTSDQGVYSVAVFNSVGSVISSPATLTVGTVSAVPTGLFGTPGNNQVWLNWFGAAGATNYNVKRYTQSGGPYQTIATVAATTHTDLTAFNGVTYYYVVSSLNALGESANSVEASTTPAALHGAMTIQAEDVLVANGGGVTLDSANPGYHVASYANFPLVGGYLQFNNVNGGTGGPALFGMRFALGAASPRIGNLVVNGTVLSVTNQPTGDWTNWVTMSVEIMLGSGSTNTIRLESTGQDLGNIDEITVVPTVVNTPPMFAQPLYDGNSLILSGRGGTPGADYQLLMTTNLALPLGFWEGVQTNQFDGDGRFSITNPILPWAVSQFYRLWTE